MSVLLAWQEAHQGDIRILQDRYIACLLNNIVGLQWTSIQSARLQRSTIQTHLDRIERHMDDIHCKQDAVAVSALFRLSGQGMDAYMKYIVPVGTIVSLWIPKVFNISLTIPQQQCSERCAEPCMPGELAKPIRAPPSHGYDEDICSNQGGAGGNCHCSGSSVSSAEHCR